MAFELFGCMNGEGVIKNKSQPEILPVRQTEGARLLKGSGFKSLVGQHERCALSKSSSLLSVPSPSSSPFQSHICSEPENIIKEQVACPCSNIV